MIQEIVSFPLISRGNNPNELLGDREYLAVAVDVRQNTERIVGYILVRPPIDKTPASIEYVEVLSEYQKQGIGSSLIKKAITHLKSLGRTHVSLFATTVEMKALSKEFGFFEKGSLLELNIQ
jgi:ribosomal protein S18 acetylase RimI-like enzyme